MFVARSPRKKSVAHPQPGDIVDCPICRGTGKYLLAKADACLRCHGTGKAVIVQARCPVCQGNGTVGPSATPCHVCHNPGWICKVH